MSDVEGIGDEIAKVKLVVNDFADEYDNDWTKLVDTVERIGRDEEEERHETGIFVTTTALVHLVLNDETCSTVPGDCFSFSQNICKLTAPYITTVEGNSFGSCHHLTEVILPSAKSVADSAFYFCLDRLAKVSLPDAASIDSRAFCDNPAIRHVILHPNASVSAMTFCGCHLLEVLAASAGFETDTGDYNPHFSERLDPTVAITRYLKSQCEKDKKQRDVFLTYNFMLKLCNHHTDKKTGVIRATPQEHDRLANFLNNNEDVASYILSFFGLKWGENDLRNASRERLLELALQKKVLREDENGNSTLGNEMFWGVRVDSNGDVVEDV